MPSYGYRDCRDDHGHLFCVEHSKTKSATFLAISPLVCKPDGKNRLNQMFERKIMKINMYMNRLANFRGSFYVISASLIMASIIFMTLPFGSAAQTGSADDRLKPNGKKVAPSDQAASMRSKMSVDSFAEVMTASTQNKATVVKTNTAGGAAVNYAILNIEYKTPAGRRLVFTDLKRSAVQGAYVLTVIDRFADVFVESDAAWNAIKKDPNVLRVELGTIVTAPPSPEASISKLPSEAIAESIVRGGYQGLTGKNVIIAVLDTGIDFRHPDFITWDPQARPISRITYLWDTATEYQSGRGSVAPFKFPNGTSIGTLYTREQLTNELRSSKKNIPPTDLDGHGTACASVAAGTGNADKMPLGLRRPEVVGVAPEATIIGVRLGKDGLENSYLLNAISEWLETVAGASPLVISGSFGGHYTGHDGQMVQERELNARFPVTKAGRAIVFAAGNEGNDAIHAKVNFSSTAKLVSWNAREKTVINIFFDSADRTLSLIPTAATPLDKTNLTWELNPITNQWRAEITVNPGLGGIWLQNPTGKATEAHLYFMSRGYGAFSPESAVKSQLVGSPGSMENAITVGSYDWNDNFHMGGRVVNLTSVCSDGRGGAMPLEIGWLSCYSSPGPLRNGSFKPDIVSPGEWFTSANAQVNGRSAGTWATPDSTGMYREMNGTSAATPYTAGIVALMFQKKPTLTLGDLKALLKGKASTSGLLPFGQATPNSNWGYGKLDAAAVSRIFASL